MKTGTGWSRRTRTKLDWTQVIMCLAPLLLQVPRAEAQLTNYWRLHSFGRTNLVGENPEGTLIQDRNGFIYGVASRGGVTGGGTVFRVGPDGSEYTTLHQFDNSPGSSDGYLPAAGLLATSDRALYGTTFGNATIFKLNKDGTEYRTLHYFTADEGFGPPSALVEGADGVLYGTTDHVVFKMDKDGSNFTLFFDSFVSTDPNAPYTLNGVIQASNGRLYGTSSFGGTNDLGTVFKLEKDGTAFSVLWRFTGTNGDGSAPMTGLVEAKDGVLFGTTHLGGTNHAGTIFRLNKDGSGHAVIHHFNPIFSDGYNPNVLRQGSDSMLYGSTQGGGAAGLGCVFRLNEDGTGYTVIKNLLSGPTDGSSPRAGLLEGADGRLYCTAYSGGKYNGSGYSTLRTFLFWPGDGTSPRTSAVGRQ